MMSIIYHSLIEYQTQSPTNTSIIQQKDEYFLTLFSTTSFFNLPRNILPSLPSASPCQQLYLIIFMSANKEEQVDQCFITDDFEEISQTEPLDIKIEISKKINEQMPANQLRAVQRPENMTARTFYLDRPLYLLKDILNASQLQTTTEVTNNRQKLRISNSQNLSLEQYFSRKKYKCVYNKLATYRNDSKSFLGKLKGIDLLIDYNWKSFKELEMEVDLLNEGEERIDSDFESGNICRAYVNTDISELEYYLLIENDLNTYGYNNWFFFRCRNQQKGARRFNIVNFIKKTNFFNQGMLVSIFSVKKHHYMNQGWFKGGDNLMFGAVNLPRQHHDKQTYYSLCFQHNFEYDNDQVYFALSQPYSYTRLIDYLEKPREISNQIKMEVKPIGYSIANNIIPIVRFYKEKSNNQNVILILGRQHPCETVGSFIAEKIMEFAISDSPISKYLASNFDVFVIPMINPDGVIHGMSRTNMAGLDLNRHWGDNILKELTPETMKIKQYIMNLSKVKRIKYMIDLHGHGKKLNTFFFCCKGNEKEKEKQSSQLLTLCMKELENRFNLYSCTFGITKDKENTVRSQMKGLGIKQSYTLQTSLYGWKDQQGQIKHYNQSDYESIAQNLMKGIFLLEADTESTYQHLGISKEAIIKQIPLIQQISEKEEKQAYENTEIMSDSDPEGDRLDMKDLIGKCENKIIKKRLQQNYTVKKNFIKKYKKLSTIQTNKQSSKNLSLRESCAPGFQTHYNPTTNNILPKDKQFLHRSDDNRAERRTIKTVKFHEKKKQSEEKQQKTKERADKRKQLIDSLNLTRAKMRARIKTEPFHQTGKKQASRNKFKHQDQNTSLTTEKIELNPQYCKTEPDQQITTKKKSQINITFNQLKKQSLSMLLTDTISIFKFKKQRQKSISRIGHVKNVSLSTKKEGCHYQTSRKNQMQKQLHERQVLVSEIMLTKVKNFNNLLSIKSSHNNKFSRQIHSVYYHYPLIG